MQPFLSHNPLDIVVLAVSFLIWRVLEVAMDLRTFKRLRAEAQRQDKGSHIVLICLVVVGILLGLLIAVKVSGTAITIASAFFFWFGIFLMYAGIALRFYAIAVLGRYFTTSVAVSSEQTVIEAGPYRLIRHPSYTGLLISLFGLGLSLTGNWLSLIVIMGCALIGFGYRIYVEERVLQKHLGQSYQEYMRRTKRLIPFVL
jgi:protein-S-isoprenylcysteine O-methyltransferase Ste14